MGDTFNIVEIYTECDIDVLGHAKLTVEEESLSADDYIWNLRSIKSGSEISEDFLEHGC